MAETQRLNTQLLLDVAITGGYRSAFDTAGIGAISPDVDTESIQAAGLQMRKLSNAFGESANEIAQQHGQLTRNPGFDAAQETILTAVEFKTTTGFQSRTLRKNLLLPGFLLGLIRQPRPVKPLTCCMVLKRKDSKLTLST